MNRFLRRIRRFFRLPEPPPVEPPKPKSEVLVGLMAHYQDVEDGGIKMLDHLGEHSQIYFDGNATKWKALLRPTSVSIHDYDFSLLDKVFDMAEIMGKPTILHTLCWPKLTFFPESYPIKNVEQRTMANSRHIDLVLKRYKGRFMAAQIWNEPISLDGRGLKSYPGIPALTVAEIGDGLEAAEVVAPDVPLGLNEHSCEKPGPKQDGYFRLATNLLKDGYPLDFLGFQCHLNVKEPVSRKELEATFKRAASLGLDVHLTEIDIRINENTAQALALQENQALALGQAIANSPNVKVATFWGPHNGLSWIYKRYGEAYPNEKPLPFAPTLTPNRFWQAFNRGLGRDGR